jgi:SAM-dependent methyltransferase
MSWPELTNRPCPLCGGCEAEECVESTIRAEWQTVGELRPFWFGIDKERRFFTYHRCRGCGLLYNRDFFGEAQLAELYSAMPPNMDQVTDEAIEATQRGYYDAALASGLALQQGDYLEIGPDVGHVLGEAVTRGSFGHFWLFEPNRRVHEALRLSARGKPATILAEMTDLSAVPDGSVGLAVMVHVLDHLLDPLAMLAAIRAKLKPGGALMLVTHNERSLLSNMLGPRWPAFCLQHPQLYNPRTIKRMCEQAGFAGVEVARSANHFPLDFLGRQGLAALGMRGVKLPLPTWPVRLRLGNIITLASAGPEALPQAARSAETRLLESVL